ncbi:MAG TPA: NapC/NirT family cytochrome c [Bryobacteraceae bacterium]|jgi:nitrate/TMAO reductase-like tetraheme cytochrome c subunit|nr:NapC/NirT family cytochrome c [Bryobacteraceae bacterium]
MNASPKFKLPRQLSPLVHLSNNWVSLIGVVVVTTATVFWLFLLPTTMSGEIHNPYNGILAFLLLPLLFFSGLILIPLGIYWRNRREKLHGLYPSEFPPLNLRNVEFRRLLTFVGVTTFANIVIASQLAYGAVSYMETVSFCGQTCHTVMQPEFTAYQSSPHSRVECVQCHIGPGESWFVRSKLSGIRQVFAVMFHTYETPIPTPVRNLRPARETCEACHWPQKYGEDRLRVINKFGDDENNSPVKTVLLMKIGGGNHGIGIHGTHLGPGVHIRYGHSDVQRQVIPWIEYSGPGGKTVYRAEGAPVDGKGLSMREMDCIDCHNRPSHAYKLPERAVDEAMFAGELSASLPFAHKKSIEILKKDYASRETAAAQIPAALAAFYRDTYPAVYKERQAEVVKTAISLLAIYNRNVFPAMKVTWGSYPNNIGHTDFPGCFRCHDDSHASRDGRKVTQDCGACHSLLAMEEAAPKILTELGVVESKEQK